MKLIMLCASVLAGGSMSDQSPRKAKRPSSIENPTKAKPIYLLCLENKIRAPAPAATKYKNTPLYGESTAAKV